MSGSKQAAGGAASDADGTVAGWAWDFGDGTTGAGRTAQHTYAAAGTYPVRLTVTDNDGATASTSADVTVSAPTVTTYARDAFGRTTANGWGAADVGGAWSTTGTASSFGVSGGQGRVSAPPGASRTAWFNGIAQSATEVDARLSLDKAQTGSGSYVALLGRRVNATTDYRFKVRAAPTGTVTAQLVRNVGNVETVIQNISAVAGLTYAPGDVLLTRFRVSGTGTTTLAAKVWKDGTTEPATWQLQSSDATAALQVPGSVGIWYYLSSAATISPMVLSVDDFSATALP
jgi:PKD repeat protein